MVQKSLKNVFWRQVWNIIQANSKQISGADIFRFQSLISDDACHTQETPCLPMWAHSNMFTVMVNFLLCDEDKYCYRINAYCS